MPSPAYRRALQVCAHLLITTEEQEHLRAALEPDADPDGGERIDVPALFEWLREQPYIEAGPDGLYPHDLVREVLNSEMRWRDPTGYREMHRRLRSALPRRTRATPEADWSRGCGS